MLQWGMKRKINWQHFIWLSRFLEVKCLTVGKLLPAVIELCLKQKKLMYKTVLTIPVPHTIVHITGKKRNSSLQLYSLLYHSCTMSAKEQLEFSVISFLKFKLFSKHSLKWCNEFSGHMLILIFYFLCWIVWGVSQLCTMIKGR